MHAHFVLVLSALILAVPLSSADGVFAGVGGQCVFVDTDHPLTGPCPTGGGGGKSDLHAISGTAIVAGATVQDKTYCVGISDNGEPIFVECDPAGLVDEICRRMYTPICGPGDPVLEVTGGSVQFAE